MFTNLFNGIEAARYAAAADSSFDPVIDLSTCPSRASLRRRNDKEVGRQQNTMPPPPKPGLPLDKDKATPPLHSATTQVGSSANIVVEIGSVPTKYYVQKAFLMHYSDYFRKALSGTWKEAEEGVVKLVDVEQAVFNLFLEWLYTQQVPVNGHEYSRIANPGLLFCLNTTGDMWKIKLYVFADRFAVPALRTAMNRQIVNDTDAISRITWDYVPIIYAFDNLPSTDPLLDLFVDRYYMHWDGYGSMQSLPHDFLHRFLQRVGGERAGGRKVVSEMFKMDLCIYHEHATDAEKSSCPHKSSLGDGKYALVRPIRSETRLQSMFFSSRPASSAS